jgi:GT2 family glycosyltransferase
MVKIDLFLRPSAGYPMELQFDPGWYRETYGLTSSWTQTELERYFWQTGEQKGHNFSPYFNPAFVRMQLRDVGIDIDSQEDPRDAYLKNASIIDPHPLLPRNPTCFSTDPRLGKIGNSDWFNKSVFILRMLDNQTTRHSLFFDPGFMVDTDGRPLERPLETYLRYHARSDMKVSALFDPDFYRSAYPDLARAIEEDKHRSQSLLEHFATFGINENRLPFPDFDADHYASQYPELAAGIHESGLSPIRHFLYFGIAEHRDPNPYFNTQYYLEAQPHVLEEIRRLRLTGPFEHFLKIGYKAGLKANRPLHSVDLPEYMGKALYERKCDHVTRKLMRDKATLTFPVFEGAPKISCIIPVVNQGHMTINLLEQLSNIAWRRDMPEMEVIVVDNGSTDVTLDLPKVTEGLTLVRSDKPLGYPGACNQGAAVARGDVLVFMNNDIEVDAGSFQHGLEQLTMSPDIGAVGGKIILLNGVLQEAGSVMFLDGSARGVGRHEDPNLAEYNIARKVDYCSGCFLFVRRSDFEALNGFDEVFSPGYYEEADLCFRLKDKDLATLYDPRISIRHYEYASYSKGRPAKVSMALMRRNQKIFCQRHKKRLAGQPVPGKDTWRRPWFNARHGNARSIAMVEDFIPDPAAGSGFVRSVDIIERMLEDGHRVTLFAQHYMAGVSADHLRQRGVEVVECYHDASPNPLEGREWSFDVLWICRTHSIRPWSTRAMAVKAINPDITIVFDTEAVAAYREVAYRELMGLENKDTPEDMIARELESALPPDAIVAVNEIDRAAIAAQSISPVYELGHRVMPRRDAPGLAARTGLFFCGAFHDEDSPNFDSIKWMVEQVWPILRAERPDAELTIVGHSSPQVGLKSLLAGVEGVNYLGRVGTLEAYMDSARVFIAPTRYAGGIPHKVHEALAAGLPVVCTDLLRRQLATTEIPPEVIPVLSSKVNDEKGFATDCLNLLQDDALWEKLRKDAFDFIDATASDEVFTRNLRNILNVL